jgi:hypothetical protein
LLNDVCEDGYKVKINTESFGKISNSE